MSRRIMTMVALGVVTWLGTGDVRATDVGAGSNMSAIQAGVTGDGIINFNASATLTMDANGTGVNTITVQNGMAAVIAFGVGANDYKIIFGNAAGAITLLGNSTLTITGTDTGAGFDFSTTASGKTLTITSSSAGTLDSNVAANRIILGNTNTLTFASPGGTFADALNEVFIAAGATATIDVDEALTIRTLTVTSGDDMDFNIAQGITATVTTAVALAGDSILEVIADATAGNDTLAFTGGLTLNGTSQLRFTNDTGAVTGGVTAGATGVTIDVNGSASINAVAMNANATINVATNETLTTAVDVNANTLTLNEATGGTISTVNLDTAGGVLNVDENCTITNSTISANATISVASGKTLTATNAIDFTGTTLTVNEAGTISDLKLNNAVCTLDVNESCTITTCDLTANATIDVLADKTLTVTDGVDTQANKLTVTGTGVISRVDLDGDGAVLDVDADYTITTCNLSNNAEIQVANGFTLTSTVNASRTLTLSEAGSITTVNLDASSSILDVDADCTLTNCDLTANASIDVLAGKTLTVTNGVDTNTSTLTLAGTGTINQVDIDGTGGGVKLTAAASTITTLTHTAAGTIDLDTNGCNLTVTNEIDVGAQKLTLNGSGGTDAETLTATVDLNHADSELEVTGADPDNPVITEVKVSADGGTIDTNINFAPTAINMTAGAGDLTLEVAAGKTLSSTITVNDNALTLSETGVPGTIALNNAGSVLDVNESCTPTAVNLTADVTIDVATTKTLTANLDVAARTLTLAGAGTLSQVNATTGTITANGTTTITTLTANPAANNTFTYGGTGASTVTTFTAFDATGETLAKTGLGSLTVTNGFSFNSSTGIKLNVNAGTFVDAGGTAITFGDDAEEIVVANGATYTTSSDITGNAGTNTNLDAVAGSTVNFAKAGTLTLTATANNDFKLLGTVNVLDGCTVQMAGAFQSQFGSVNIKTTGAWLNTVPNASMLFSPGSTVTLEGTGSGALTINGQATTTRIIMDTTTGSGTFTLDRGSSNSLTIHNASIANCIYTSASGNSAEQELQLTGVLLGSNNTNWSATLTANAGPDKTIAPDGSTTLEGSASGGTGTYTYAWTPTTGLSNANIATPNASPTETTTYTLTVNDGVNIATDTVVVTVGRTASALLASAGQDQQIALGESVVLNGSASGGSGTYTYTWTPTTGLSDPIIANPTASPTETTTYTLTVTDTADSSTATDDVVVTVVAALTTCGTGVCGNGTAPLMPLTLTTFLGWSWRLRRRR